MRDTRVVLGWLLVTFRSGRIPLYIALLFVLIADHRHLVSREVHDWTFFVLGGALALSAVIDVADGTTISFYSSIERSKDPVGFWVFIALSGGVGAAGAIGALGGLLKLWAFSVVSQR